MIFTSETRLKAMIIAIVKSQMQNALWGWNDDKETPGLYREFDSLHSQIRALQLQVKAMQSKIDDFQAMIIALGQKVDALKARPEGIPVDVFDSLAAQLRDILAKLG